MTRTDPEPPSSGPFAALLRNDKIAVFDFTLRQIGVLEAVIAATEDVSVKEIAATLTLSKPAITRALDRLVLHGLVQRTPNKIDRRLVICTPTRLGRSMMAVIHEIARAA